MIFGSFPVRRARLTPAAVMLAAVAAWFVATGSAHTRSTQVTWTKDVAPIVERRCAGCHAPDGIAPMSLSSYHDARARARQIRRHALERTMPPWPAEPGFGDFQSSRSLTPIEIDLLADWADGGAPLGPEASAVPPVSDAPAFQPDVVLELPNVTLAAGKAARVEIATAFTRERWITGWEFRPGDRARVKRAVLSVGGAGAIGSWVAADGFVSYPAGIAQSLPAGARLVVDLYAKRSSPGSVDGGTVALRFGRTPRRVLQHRMLSCGRSTIETDMDVLALTPHAASAGARVEVSARRTDASVEPMLVIGRFDPAYPLTYRFRSPLRLERGTSLRVASGEASCGVELEYVRR